jgi:hypothetical protein
VELNNQPFPEPKGSTHAYVDHENDLIFPISGTSTLLGFSFFREHKRRKKKKKKNLHAHLHSFVFLLLKNPSNSLTRHGSKHLLCSLYVISNLIVLVFGFATAN